MLTNCVNFPLKLMVNETLFFDYQPFNFSLPVKLHEFQLLRHVGIRAETTFYFGSKLTDGTRGDSLGCTGSRTSSLRRAHPVNQSVAGFDPGTPE